MRILHTEASCGWGGQEIRIFNEACGMRERGHEIVFAVAKGSEIAKRARSAGFTTYELNFSKSPIPVYKLVWVLMRHRIQIINTHSSLDAWIGGIAAKIAWCKIIRTRHLSTPVRKGINSILLYDFLADFVVTTCAETKETIETQAKLPAKRIVSIPTGVSFKSIEPKTTAELKAKLGIKEGECVVGTCCVLRGWKGVSDLLYAAHELREVEGLKWVVVGGGVSEEYFKGQWRELKLEEKVIFTGHIENPLAALSLFDIFLLLSWANEGVSQSSLQAASLKKPLITTPTGGLKEVCIDSVTGLLVPTHAPRSVADAVMTLFKDQEKRKKMGEAAYAHVEREFTFEKTLDEMEKIYAKCTQ